MLKFIIAGFVFHFLGMMVYVTTIDQIYCQGEGYNPDCYAWKGPAGLWEAVVFQEIIIRPMVKAALDENSK
jgi:hypothetical protein